MQPSTYPFWLQGVLEEVGLIQWPQLTQVRLSIRQGLRRTSVIYFAAQALKDTVLVIAVVTITSLLLFVVNSTLADVSRELYNFRVINK